MVFSCKKRKKVMDKMSAVDYRAKSDSIEEMLKRKDFFSIYIEQVIKKNDKNKNNCIDKDELFETFKEFNTEKIKLPINAETVGKIMEVYDKDKNGTLSREEFGAYFKKMLVKLSEICKVKAMQLEQQG